jgi:CubicO group peptidase (beta-lactamase class C family)
MDVTLSDFEAAAEDKFGLLQGRLQNLVDRDVLPGVAVAVHGLDQSTCISAGVRVARRAADMDDRTLFPLGCIIKPLISLVFLELQARGELEMSKSIDHYLPELRSEEVLPVTSEHLLCHTGGYVEPDYPDARWKLDWAGFADGFRERRQLFRPGAVWSYTQTGHAILGRIIQEAVGRDPIELIKAFILDPLGVQLRAEGMDGAEARALPHIRAGDRFHPTRVQRSAGLLQHSISELHATAPDLALIACALGGPLLPEAISAEAFELFARTRVRIPAASGSGPTEAVPTAYGLGLARFGGVVGQTGTLIGTTCVTRFDPVTRTGVAVAMNAWTPGLRDQVVADVLAMAAGRQAAPAPTQCRTTFQLEDLEGCYTGLMLGGARCEARCLDGVLHLSLEAGGGTPLSARLRITDQGVVVMLACDAPWLSFAIAADPTTGAPYLLIGPQAYCRV